METLSWLGMKCMHLDEGNFIDFRMLVCYRSQSIFMNPLPHRQNKCTPHQYSTPLRTIKNTPHYISCLFADVHFAHLFTGPSDFYTINIITHTGNTVLVANLQRDFNYDYISMDALAKSSHAYARYGLQSSCLNMNGQAQAVDSHKIIGYLTTQTTINEEVFIYCHVISKMYST